MTQENGATTNGTATTARGRVRDEMRRLILSGEFGPGTRLTQQQLAKRFGVAQSVIRESLLELESSGLVESVDNLGVFVSGLDNTKLIEAYQVREMLEGLAARICCERASRADVKELSEMVERIHQLGTEQKEQERGSLDRQFHQRMIEIAQNTILSRLTAAYRVLGMTVTASRPHDVVRSEHQTIVKAIEENRPDDAERLARSHVAESRKAIEQQIAEKKFVPKWVVE
jgi:DNA-binding GntR family transcriptional regulator